MDEKEFNSLNIKTQERIHAHQTVLTETLWFSLTTIGINAAIISFSEDSVDIGNLPMMIGSLMISLYAIRLVLTRHIAYYEANHTYNGEAKIRYGIFRALVMVMKERSGALFYIMIISFSFIGVILSKINFNELINNALYSL